MQLPPEPDIGGLHSHCQAFKVPNWFLLFLTYTVLVDCLITPQFCDTTNPVFTLNFQISEWIFILTISLQIAAK